MGELDERKYRTLSNWTRDNYRRDFSLPSYTEEVKERDRERKEGAELHPEKLTEYKQELRELIHSPEGLVDFDYGKFFSNVEYLTGSINEETRDKNIALVGSFGKILDYTHDMHDGDMGKVFDTLIDYAQPRYYKNARTVDEALNEGLAACYSTALTTLAFISNSEVLKDLPVKLQWFTEHVRVLVKYEHQWLAIEPPGHRSVPAANFAGTVVTGPDVLVKSLVGEPAAAYYYDRQNKPHRTHSYGANLSFQHQQFGIPASTPHKRRPVERGMPEEAQDVYGVVFHDEPKRSSSLLNIIPDIPIPSPRGAGWVSEQVMRVTRHSHHVLPLVLALLATPEVRSYIRLGLLSAKKLRLKNSVTHTEIKSAIYMMTRVAMSLIFVQSAAKKS